MGTVPNHTVIRNMRHLKDKIKTDGLNFSVATDKGSEYGYTEMKHQYSYYSVHQHLTTQFCYAMFNSEE